MTSLTSWPTNGRASTAVELLDHRRGAEQVGRHQDAEAGLVALGGHEDERHQVAAPGHAVPAGGQGEAARCRARTAACVDLGRRRGQRHVAQVEGRRGGFRRCGVALGSAAAIAASAPLAGGPALPGTGSPSAPASSSSSRRLHTVFISKRSKVAAAVARSHAAQGQVVDVDVERHVAHERDDAGVASGPAPRSRPGSRAASASARRGGRRCRRGRRTW